MSALENRDLSHDIAAYLIPSSHNSYLASRSQIWGFSDAGMYRLLIEDLGCHCIEIDVHNGLDDLPIVTHGRTLCTTLMLSDVLTEIRSCLLKRSSAAPPLIISLEIRTNPLQTAVAARQLRALLGPWLVDFDAELHTSVAGLAGKVLVQNAVGVPLPIGCIPTINISERHLMTRLNETDEFFRHHLTRVFPAGWRIFSSNPPMHLRRSQSMLALNYQSDPVRCSALRGYVLKNDAAAVHGPLAWYHYYATDDADSVD